MTQNLAARQLAQTKRELERSLKRRDREKLRTLRVAIKNAKVVRRQKMREVAAQCRSARARNMTRAKRARQRLRDSIRRTREHAKQLCVRSRAQAQASALHEIEKAVGALDEERVLQRLLAVWTTPQVCAVNKGRREQRQQESDCEVVANIDEPGMRIVWEHVKHKIKATPRQTRTESFYQWVHDHSADVYAIQEADAERALRALEQEEKRAARDARKEGRYRSKSVNELKSMLEAVPF